MFTDIDAAIEEARKKRKQDGKRHYAVNQRISYFTVGKCGKNRGKRPAWTTRDDLRPESHGVHNRRVNVLEPSDIPLIVGLLALGLKQGSVAEKFDISRSGVRKAVKAYKNFSERRSVR
ncbi:hypothetical protein M2263_001835 [Providencia alcalifaciens]|nr:hypothetical protein [Providencia alcalifaciens]